MGSGGEAPRTPSGGTGWRTPRKITGRLDEVYVKVDTVTERHGKSSTTYTRLHAGYPDSRSLELGLTLTEEGFFSGIQKFFGAQDIQLGDDQFDGGFLVKGKNEDRVREFLTPARRHQIEQVFRSFPGATVTDSGIAWRQRGVIRSADRIEAMVRSLAKATATLSRGRGVEESHVVPIVGETDTAKRTHTPVRAAGTDSSAATDSLEPDREARSEKDLLEIEARPPEVEIRNTAGGREAQKLFDAVGEHGEPPEVRLADRAALPTPPPGLGAAAVSEALFDPKRTSLDINRLFESRYLHSMVEWSGTLKSVEAYSYDFIFGNEPGARAVVEIHELADSAFGGAHVCAVIRLPADSRARLAGRTGETVSFRGRLVRVDALMKNVFVDQAEIPD